MRQPSLVTRLILWLTLIVLAGQAVIFFWSAERVRSWLLDKEISALKDIASLVRDMAGPQLHRELLGEEKFWLIGMSARWSFRISLIGADGQPLDDSILAPGLEADTRGVPEIEAAGVHDEGVNLRWSTALEKLTLHYAEPVKQDGHILGYLRISSDADKINKQFGEFYWFLLLLSLACYAVVATAMLLLSRSTSRALGKLTQAARELTAGAPFSRVNAGGPPELRPLQEAFNNLLARTERQLAELAARSQESEAVLEGMSEAVLLLDPQLQIVKMNSAAGRLFKTPGDGRGRHLLEVCRSSELQAWARSLLAGTAAEPRLEVQLAITGQHLQASGTRLSSGDGPTAGLVLVITDSTHSRRVDQMRKDFVANVSHELRTPITNILGYVETLNSASDLGEKQRQQFLEVIERHARRMSLIVEDLLSLSRLESGRLDPKDFTPTDLGDLLRRALDALAERIRQKKLTVHLTAGRNEGYPALASLLEQACLNLIDNAVKFSREGGSLFLTLTRTDTEVRLTVRDEGEGIPARDLDRVFERFFRSERSRSTEGTGLGLAIVKHIALLHGGTVTVESQLGQGSTFTLHLPIPAQ